MAWSGKKTFTLALVSRFVLGSNHGPGRGEETALLSHPGLCRRTAHGPPGSADFDSKKQHELEFPLGSSVFSPNSDLGSCLHNVGKQQLPKAGVAWGSIIRKRRRFCCQLHEIGHPVTVFSTELQCCKKPTKCSFPEGGTAAERGHPTQSVWPKRRLLRTLCQIEEKFSWVKTSPYHQYL